jgi:phage gp36-like protein
MDRDMRARIEAIVRPILWEHIDPLSCEVDEQIALVDAAVECYGAGDGGRYGRALEQILALENDPSPDWQKLMRALAIAKAAVDGVDVR